MKNVLLVLAVAACGLLWLEPVPPASKSLPEDPGLTSGTLSNGLRYHLLSAPNQSDDLAILLQVRVGSAGESAETRGIAHFIEHLAFNGSSEFPGNKMAEDLREMGISLGKDANASTGRDATRYTIRVPEPDTRKVGAVLRMLAGVLGRLELADAAAREQRSIIYREMATVDTLDRRLEQARFRNIFEGAALNLEPTIGTRDTLASITSGMLREFYKRWYRPGNAALVVCGDTSAIENLSGLVEDAFGHLPAGGDATTQNFANPDAASGNRFFVQQDPLLRTDNLWMAVRRPQAAVRDVENFRRWLLGELMIVMTGNRLDSQASAGEIEADQVFGGRSRILDGVEVYALTAVGPSGNWQSLASGLRDEMQRIMLHGFTEAELAAGKSALLDGLEKADPPEAKARSAAETTQRFVYALDNCRQWMPSGEVARLAESLLPSLSADDVKAAFSEIFLAGPTSVVLETCSIGGNAPETASLERVFRSEGPRDLLPYSDAPRATVEFVPTGPRIEPVSRDFDEQIQVDVQEFANGVRIRTKEMDSADGLVRLAVVFPGVLGLEDGETRGLTAALATLLSNPEIGHYAAADVSRWMIEHGVRFDAKTEGANLNLVLACKPVDLAAAVRCLNALVVNFSCSENNLARRLRNARADRSKTEMSPTSLAVEELRKIAYGGDARALAGDFSGNGRADARSIQFWWRKILHAVPARLSLVGPRVDPDAATAAASIFAGLQTDNALAAKIRPALRETMAGTDTEASLQNPENSTLVLMAGELHLTDAKEVMTAMVTTRLLNAVLMQEIREDAGLAYGTSVSFQNGIAKDLKDLLLFTLKGSGGLGAKLSQAAKKVISGFQVDDQDLAAAKEGTLQKIAADAKSASYWSAQLAATTDNERLAEEIVGARALVDAVIAADVMRLIADIGGGDKLYTVIVDRESDGFASREEVKRTSRPSRG